VFSVIDYFDELFDDASSGFARQTLFGDRDPFVQPVA